VSLTGGRPVPRAQLPHDGGMCDVGILDALMPAFEEWLHSRGLFLARLPSSLVGIGVEDIPYYAIGISDHLWESA